MPIGSLKHLYDDQNKYFEEEENRIMQINFEFKQNYGCGLNDDSEVGRGICDFADKLLMSDNLNE